MEELNDLLYDDVEAKFLALKNKKKKRQKRRRQIRFAALMLIIVFALLFFSSDSSKVKSLKVSGNIFYSEEAILEKANLSYNSRYLLKPKFLLKWRLKRDKLIDDATITKKGSSIYIDVTEKTIIGYLIEDGANYVYTIDHEKVEIQSENLETIINFPLIDGFDDEELEKLADGFAQKDMLVTPDVISMIAEIVPYASSYDAHMIKIVMQDGNKIYTSYDAIPYMIYYKATLEKMKADHVCLFLGAATESFQKSDCSEFE